MSFMRHTRRPSINEYDLFNDVVEESHPTIVRMDEATTRRTMKFWRFPLSLASLFVVCIIFFNLVMIAAMWIFLVRKMQGEKKGGRIGSSLMGISYVCFVPHADRKDQTKHSRYSGLEYL